MVFAACWDIYSSVHWCLALLLFLPLPSSLLLLVSPLLLARMLQYPLLHKATGDNETTCPGYVYDEIIKLSYVSVGHRTHLVDFLLSRLQVTGCCGKQKVVNVLRHLTQKGHPATRNLLRVKDTQLRAVGGPTHALQQQSDPSLGGLHSSPMHQPPNSSSSHMVVNAKTPQLLLHSAVQELLVELFDPQLIRTDEEKIRLGDRHPSLNSSSAQPGMGSSAATATSLAASGGSSKYQGFGSSAFNTSPTVINKVRGLVDRILWPDVKELSPTAKAILKPDHGSYVPFEIPTEYLGELAPCFNSAGGGILGTTSSASSTHRGVAGGSTLRDVTDVRSSVMEKSAMSEISPHVGPVAGSKGRGSSVYGGSSSSSLLGSSPRIVKGRAHRAGQAGGGWEDDEDLDDEKSSGGSSAYSFRDRSYSLRDTPSLPPLGVPSGSTNPRLEGVGHQGKGPSALPSTSSPRFEEPLGTTRDSLGTLSGGDLTNRSRSSSSREAEFLREFLTVCSVWPVPYGAFMDLCKLCSLFDSKSVLLEIAALFYQELPYDPQPNAQDDGDSSVPCHQPPPPRSTLLPHHHQMALLTLVDLSIHDDVFSPLDVREALSRVLELLQNDHQATDVVRTRAHRLALVTARLAQVCERRGA